MPILPVVLKTQLELPTRGAIMAPQTRPSLMSGDSTFQVSYPRFGLKLVGAFHRKDSEERFDLAH